MRRVLTEESFRIFYHAVRLAGVISCGLLKKVTSSVLAIFLCSRTESTLGAQKRLWPCWTNLFEQHLAVGVNVIIEETWI